MIFLRTFGGVFLSFPTFVDQLYFNLYLYANSTTKAISCFLSVLRQFKIVKLTRQPEGKKISFKKQNCLCMLY
jgi:hypothetical protein